MKASAGPVKLPVTGMAMRMPRATATGIRFAPPTLRLGPVVARTDWLG